MPDYTSKQIQKPLGADNQDVTVIRSALDRINDYGMGAVLCTSTTRPTGSNLWDGLIIWETDTKTLQVYSAATLNWNLVLNSGSSAAATQTTPVGGFNTGGGAVVTYDTVKLSGNVTYAAGIFTVASAGLYRVSSKMGGFDQSGGTTRWFWLAKNGSSTGSALPGCYMAAAPSFTSIVQFSGLIIKLAAGDTLRSMALQDSGSTASLSGASFELVQIS